MKNSRPGNLSLLHLFQRLQVVFILMVLSSFTQAQTLSLSGKVIDAETAEPLAFVNLMADNEHCGCLTDIDGNFKLDCDEKISTIRISYVGYFPLEYPLGNQHKNLVFKLQPTHIELLPVIVSPKENPANRIIRKVIANKEFNDPEKLASFSYTAYEKTIFTLGSDTLLRIDTTTRDTSYNELKELLKDKDLAIVESVYKRYFKLPDNNYQKVLANRISGLNSPLFVFLVSQLQSTSFYHDVLQIFDKSFVNPISPGSLKRYYFQIEDTLFPGSRADSVFVLTFRPLINHNFDGLTGMLYISSDGYAIQNVIAEPEKKQQSVHIRIQQMYEKIDSLHWFPVQLNTDIDFNSVSFTDSAMSFGGHPKGIGKTYLKDIQVNKESDQRIFSEIEMDVDLDAHKQNEEFWNQHRRDSLTARERRTYEFVDSLGKKAKIDQKIKFFESLSRGRYPVHFLDVDLNRLFHFNDHEGWFLGLGLLTNDRVSRRLRLGAYYGYGLKDQASKYGGSFKLNLLPRHEVELSLAYRNDVTEAGEVRLVNDNSMAINDRLRNFLIEKMDITEEKDAFVNFRIQKWYKWGVGIRQSHKIAGYSYSYNPDGNSTQAINSFDFTSLIAGFRFAYKERFLQSGQSRMSMGTRDPVLYLQYSRGVKDLLGGEYQFNRFDLRISHSLYFKYFGRTSLILRAGWMDGAMPYTELYNGNGSFRQFIIYAPGSFATMRMNEFLSDRYAALYISHNFQQLLLRKKYFSPEISLMTNMGIGALKHPEVHKDVKFNTMEKGYFESGIMLNKLLRMNMVNLGFGAFYRYGDYSYSDWKDNFSWKFSVVLPFAQ